MTTSPFAYDKRQHLQHPDVRACLDAAYLLHYWASKGRISNCEALIEGLVRAAALVNDAAEAAS